jgi:alpha-ribazole phosphatase
MIRFPALLSDRPTRVYLLRHGEVVTHERKCFNGHTDVALTARGISQMETVSQRLAGEAIRTVYTSDLQRAIQGGETLARVFSVSRFTAPALREKNFGKWEGLAAREVAQLYPKSWAEWMADPAESIPEGGESYREAHKRVIPALGDLLAKHPGEQIAIVAHSGVNRLILGDALGQPLSAIFRIEQKYAALNVIDYFKDRILVKGVNG